MHRKCNHFCRSASVKDFRSQFQWKNTEKNDKLCLRRIYLIIKEINITRESMMGLSEEAMSYLEEHIPELANVAFKQAYWAALASGSSVLISENGKLLEVFPDGSHKFIKHLAPSIRVTPGQRLEINV
jgi:hypothetical protein